MKYCGTCGNTMKDGEAYCPTCGTKTAVNYHDTYTCAPRDDYAEYWGMHYRDAESGKEIELMPDGIRVYNSSDDEQLRFRKRIPYAKIIDIKFERAKSGNCGYISLITPKGGITGKATRQQLLFDHNTVQFTEETEFQVKRIYNALADICEALPSDDSSSAAEQLGEYFSTRSQKKKKARYGWLIPLIILFALIIIMVVVSNGKKHLQDTSTVVSSDNEPQISSEKDTATIPTVKIGDTITTNNCEFTIGNIEFLYDVLPDDTSSFYTHYEAEHGKVYLCVSASVKNTAKQNLNCDEIGSATVDYNGGYRYSSFTIVDDATLGFTYANITDIPPLMTQGIKFLVECPQEIETSTSPLVLTLLIDGCSFVFNIR